MLYLKEIIMDECLILIDGMYLFKEQKRLFPRKKILSNRFDRLIREVANGYEIIEVILFANSLITGSIWESFRPQSFPLRLCSRSFQDLVVRGTKILVTHKSPATLKILSGDREFTPLVEIAQEEKWDTEIWGFSSTISHALANMVTQAKTLDDIFEKISKV
jgi:hypothetical protein